MIFMFMNIDATMYVRSKHFNELLLNISKELKILNFTLCNQFFSFTNDFNSSGGRVMKFPASGHRSLVIEARGKCKYYSLRYSDYTEITFHTYIRTYV